MSRLDRKLAKFDLDEVAIESGWHRGKLNHRQRTVNYYKGNSYVNITFSQFLYDVSDVMWWDSATSRMNVYSRHDGDLMLSWLIQDIFKGKVDPSDLRHTAHYIIL